MSSPSHKQVWDEYLLDLETEEMEKTAECEDPVRVGAWRRGGPNYPNIINEPELIVQGSRYKAQLWIYVLHKEP